MRFHAFSGRSLRRKSPPDARRKHPFGRGGSSRTLRLENLEARHLLTVALTWSGPGTALDLTENTAGATPAIAISEPSPRVGVLKIDLGAGCSFAGGSTTSATGLTYQNAGSQHNVQSPSSSNFVPPQFGQMGCQRAASPTSSSQSARRRSSIAGETSPAGSVGSMPERNNCPGSGFQLEIFASGRSRKGGTTGCQRSWALQCGNNEVWPIPWSPRAAAAFEGTSDSEYQRNHRHAGRRGLPRG